MSTSETISRQFCIVLWTSLRRGEHVGSHPNLYCLSVNFWRFNAALWFSIGADWQVVIWSNRGYKCIRLYRQLAAGSFLISVKQLLEGEKKIRKLKLMEYKLVTDADPSIACQELHSSTEDKSWLFNALGVLHDYDSISEEELGIIYWTHHRSSTKMFRPQGFSS